MLKSFHVLLNKLNNITLFLFLMCILFTIINAKKDNKDDIKKSSKTDCLKTEHIKKFLDKMTLSADEEKNLIRFLEKYLHKGYGKVKYQKFKNFLKFLRGGRKKRSEMTEQENTIVKNIEDGNEGASGKESQSHHITGRSESKHTKTKKAHRDKSKFKNEKHGKKSKKKYQTETEVSESPDRALIDHCLLKKIADELEDLRGNSNPYCGKEGLPCYPNGTWGAERAGVLLKIHLSDSLEKVKILDKIPPQPPHQQFLNCHWDMEAHSPFPKLGYLVLYGTLKQNKNVALFVGQCKICGGAEVVMGNWLIDRGSRDCKHMAASHLIIGDVFRRIVTHGTHFEKHENEKHKKQKRKKSRKIYK